MRRLIQALLLAAPLLSIFSNSPGNARVVNPPPNSPMLLSCAGLTGTAASFCATLTSMDPSSNWTAGVHVNVFAGTQDRPSGSVTSAAGTHGGPFAAAAAQQLGIYLLRPPQGPQSGLENAQFVWLWNQSSANVATAIRASAPRAGWTNLGTSAKTSVLTAAQAYANAGYLVFAVAPAPFASASCQQSYYSYLAGLNASTSTLTYTAPASLCPGANTQTGTGQIAVVRPNAAYLAAGLVGSYGPVLAQAGSTNATAITASSAFAGYGAGQVYFFVYGGPPPSNQSAYAGIFAATNSRNSHTFGIQRTAQGMMASGIFTYDGAGLPIWYYSEGTLNPAQTVPATQVLPNWANSSITTPATTPSYSNQAFISTPSSPSPPSGSLDYPYVWKPYFQPATSGTNVYDPDGTPMPFQQVGTWNFNFGLYDNTQIATTVDMSDSGTIVTSAGTITVNSQTSVAGNETPTRVLAGSASYVQVAASNAPAAGWWWTVYNAAQWNQTSTGFVPLGLFLDIQGSAVSGVVVGASPSPASAATSAPPYRPYWLLFSGTVQSNGQIDGSYLLCTKVSSPATCTPNGTTGSIAQTSSGAITMTMGGSQITLNNYSTNPAIPPSQGIPVVAEYNLGLNWGNMAQISVGGGAPQIVTFDLGSTGAYLSKTLLDQVGAQYTVLPDSSQPVPPSGSCPTGVTVGICNSYSSGVWYVAKVALTNITIGGVTAVNVPFGLVTEVQCNATLNADCSDTTKAAKIIAKAFTDRIGTMGVVQGSGSTAATAVIASPLVQLQAPYNSGFTLSLANLSVNLGLTTAVRSAFNNIQMIRLTNAPGCFGVNGQLPCPAMWDNSTGTATLTASDGTVMSPASTIFDSGAGNIRVTVGATATTANQASLNALINDNIVCSVAVCGPPSNGQYSINAGPGISFSVNMTGPSIGGSGTTTMLNNVVVPLTSGYQWTGSGNVTAGWMSTNPNYSINNLGSPALQVIDILWDGINGYLGTRSALQ